MGILQLGSNIAQNGESLALARQHYFCLRLAKRNSSGLESSCADDREIFPRRYHRPVAPTPSDQHQPPGLETAHSQSLHG